MRLIVSLLATAAVVLAGCGDDERADSAAATPVATPSVATCDEVAHTPEKGARWVHPSQNFYSPDAKDAPSKDDIQHLLTADNAIVVVYTAKMDKAGRGRLADWASQQVAAVVVPDATEGAAQVTATIATAKLTCDALDEKQLSAFAAKRGSGNVVPHEGEG